MIKWKCDEYTLTVLPVGQFALDGGAMYGVVPKVLWNRVSPSDDSNRISLGLNCLLIEYGQEKILLDTGLGQKFSERQEAMYGVAWAPKIEELLAPLNIKPSEITQVLFTHLHFDHAGGATQQQQDGSIRPTFPNARYHIHHGEWERATQPHERSKASYLPENFLPLEEAGQVVFHQGVLTEIAPDLSLRLTGGHCLYHQCLVLDRPNKGFIYWGDLIPTRHHLKVPYVMGYDEYPLETMEKKKELLKEAVSKNWLSVFEHELDYPVCRLELTERPDTYRDVPFTGSL